VEGERMQIHTFAAIDIGSYELEMKIFELSARKGMREIDCIRYRLEMGKDTYSIGKISTEKVEDLCEILQSFVTIMIGYQVSKYRAYATSAIRESRNRVMLLDYIEKKTGLKIEVLENSEQRFLDYKSIASKENEFNKIIQKGTAIIDVGGGSVQISLFDKDRLVTTQNIRIGNLRLREKISSLERKTPHYEPLVEELVNHELNNFKKIYMRECEVKNLIVVGDHIGELTKCSSFSAKEFLELYQEVISYSIDDIAQRYEMPAESVSLLMPSLIIYKRFLEGIGAETIWMPGLNLCDGIAYEYAQQNKIIKSGHDFDEDIIAAARNMAKRYMCSKSHIKILEELALKIFDKTKKLHGLSKRERLLLQIAVILHECGDYISLSNAAECSYRIIMATEIIGLSKIEQEIIANVVRYNALEFEYLGKSNDYLLIAKLTAILRIANAMDHSHKQKFKDVRIILKENVLQITVVTPEDISLEKGLFPEKAAFFEEVFHILPVIKQKKIL